MPDKTSHLLHEPLIEQIALRPMENAGVCLAQCSASRKDAIGEITQLGIVIKGDMITTQLTLEWTCEKKLYKMLSIEIVLYSP